MPLNYELTDIKDWENVCFIGDSDDAPINPVTETLIFATASMQEWGISESNIERFYTKIRLYESLFGAFMYKYETDDYGKVIEKKERPITMDDLVAHIGLKTNGGNGTLPAFRKNALKNFEEEVSREFNSYVRDLEKFNEGS